MRDSVWDKKHFYEENERIQEEEKAHHQRNLNPQPPDLLAGALTAELQLPTSQPLVLTFAASSKNQIQLLIRILSDAINLVILMFQFWLFLGNPCWLRELLLESFCLILVNLELRMF